MIAFSKALLSPLPSALVEYSTKISLSSSTAKWNSPVTATISHPTLVALESCTSMGRLKELQAHMTRTGLVSHVFPASRLIAFCALSQQGNMNHALLLFSQFRSPNTYMWNTMIKGYNEAELPMSGFLLFGKMIKMACEVDSRTFVFALKTSERLRGSFDGACLHCLIWKMGYKSCVLVSNGLLHFYGEVGCLELARQVFDEMRMKDVISWTTMIHWYQELGYSNEALRLYNAMLESEIEPNDVTLISVLSSCSKSGDEDMGRKVHKQIIIGGRNSSLKLMNAVLDMYVKCGSVEAAREVFDGMLARDVFTWTSMVNGYGKIGMVEVARNLFDETPDKNLVSWNAMIAGYSQNALPYQAFDLFFDMIQEGLLPSENTLVCILSSCGQLGCVDIGRWIHSKYIKGKRSVIISNALIDMYAKGGLMVEAAKVFDEMRERNIATWNSMISAYGAHGDAVKAVEALEKMKCEGVAPDDITFLGVLSACSHGGMVAKGVKYLAMMKDYCIEAKEEHVSCAVDLIGRSGNVDGAYEVASRGGGKTAWGALLHSCRVHGNFELTKVAAEKLMEIDPEEAGNYVTLAASCANERRWDDVCSIRKSMREKKVIKFAGHSLIALQGDFHRFLSSDTSHPQYCSLHVMLHQLYALCLKSSYTCFYSVIF